MPQQKKNEPSSKKDIKILLVEDHPFFRQVVKKYLEAGGYAVKVAKNGKEGLENLEQSTFNLVISDIEMPVMNGWEFMIALRKGNVQQDIPAIALTSLNSEKDKLKAKKCGFDQYETKLDREKLLNVISAVMKKGTK